MGRGYFFELEGRVLFVWVSLGFEKGRGKGLVVGDLKMVFVVEMDFKDGGVGCMMWVIWGRVWSIDICEMGVE